MLSDKVQELELENRKLKVLILSQQENIPKPKNCQNCKHYRQHYCCDEYGTYYKVYTGFCICDVPIKKRKGKKNPLPEDTCLCFEKK